MNPMLSVDAACAHAFSVGSEGLSTTVVDYCFTTALLLLYYIFCWQRRTEHHLLLLYYCFTTFSVGREGLNIRHFSYVEPCCVYAPPHSYPSDLLAFQRASALQIIYHKLRLARMTYADVC